MESTLFPVNVQIDSLETDVKQMLMTVKVLLVRTMEPAQM